MKFDLTVTRTEANALEMFRSAAHSLEAMTAGVALALWCPGARTWDWETGGPLAMIGKEESGVVSAARIRLSSVDLDVLRPRYVVLATPDVEIKAPHTWGRLLSMGYEPRHPRQFTGWLDNGSNEYGYRPDVALLPSLSDPRRCLVLHEDSYVWRSSRLMRTLPMWDRIQEGGAVIQLEGGDRITVSGGIEEIGDAFGVDLFEADLSGLPRAANRKALIATIDVMRADNGSDETATEGGG